LLSASVLRYNTNMGFLRGLGRWLISLGIGLLLAAWITGSVLQASVLNRDMVKHWLATSGVYDNALKSFFMLETNQGLATGEDIQKAFDATFPPSYLRQQTETVLDATYDWIDGKSSNISFTIAIKDKREAFRDNLIKQVEPRVAALPACPTRINPNTNNPTCIPQGVNARDFAAQILQLDDDSDFLNVPITPQSLAGSGFQAPEVPQLPGIVGAVRSSLLVLPIVLLVFGAFYVLLSDSKLRGLGIIGRRVFFQGLLVVAGGVLVWTAGPTIDIAAATQGNDTQQLALAQNIINPVVRTILPDVGRLFALFGGIVTAAGGAAWLVAFIIRRKYAHITQFSPKTSQQRLNPQAAPGQDTQEVPPTPPKPQR
jgi:hypothetical protein